MPRGRPARCRGSVPLPPGVSTFLTGFSLSDLPRRLRRPRTRYCGRFTVNSPRISAKLVSVRQKCPNFFRAMCHNFVCFHTHTGFERIFSNIFFCRIPSQTFPKPLIGRHIRRKAEFCIAVESFSARISHSPPTASRTPHPEPRIPSPASRFTRQAKRTQFGMLLLLGFVNN